VTATLPVRLVHDPGTKALSPPSKSSLNGITALPGVGAVSVDWA
jgi:hypothetical protein